MKSRRLAPLLALLVLALGSLPAVAGTPPPDADGALPLGLPPDDWQTSPEARAGGIEDLGHSHVVFDDGFLGYDNCYDSTFPQPQTFCFDAVSYTDDGEDVDNLWLLFPVGWNIVNVWDAGPDTCTNGGTFGGLGWAYGSGPNEIWINQFRAQNAPDRCNTYICFAANVPGTTDTAWVSWYWQGTGGGAPPHYPCSNDGYTPGGYPPCDEAYNAAARVPYCGAAVHLYAPWQAGLGCPGETVTHTMGAWNNTGNAGNFAITYGAFSWPTFGPSSLFLQANQTATFEVLVDVPCGGVSDTGMVTISGNGSADTAWLTTNAATDGWKWAWSSPMATQDHAAISYNDKLYVLNGLGSGGAVQIYNGSWWTMGASAPAQGHVGDGCMGLDGGGNPVMDLFGDTTSFFNVQRYLIGNDSWTTFPFPAGFPGGGLWQPDIVSMLQHTGENVCYISGGATAPGGGNTSALYAYYPDTMTVTNLGSFTFHPAGFNHHASWYVPHIDAICVGGGADVNSVVLSGTQCYDRPSGAFRPPNSGLGPLPEPWCCGADGWKYSTGGHYQLWLYNGADQNLSLIQKSAYWNLGSGGWQYGPVPQHAVYRLEGDFYGRPLNVTWESGGDTGGFVQTARQEYLIQCPLCTLHVGNIVMAYRAIGGQYAVRAIVPIRDHNNNPVVAATVAADWTLPNGKVISQMATTAQNGSARFGMRRQQTGVYQICVIGVGKPGYTYDPAQNLETCESLTVP